MPFSLRVAIADDHPAMRESVRQMLRKLGHQVVAMAENGESLILQCEMTEPDVVITGTLTADMHGSDAAAVIYSSQRIPIILYSSHCEPNLVLDAEHKHVRIYLVKPIFEEHLQAALKDCHCRESQEDGFGDDGIAACVASASSPNVRAPYRGPSRPPYRQLPR